MQSEQINELATALCKAQKEIKPALKDTPNEFTKKKYADLTSTWDACREALNKNGLSVVQTIEDVYNEKDVYLVTLLIHSSGQWIKGLCPLINLKGDMQGLGSALTYARRYSLAAMVGVTADDDDGAGAGLGDSKKTSTLTFSEPPKDTKSLEKKVTKPQANMAYAKLAAKGYVGVDVNDQLIKWGYVHTDAIPFNKFQEVLELIDKLPPFKKFQDPSQPPDLMDDAVPGWGNRG